MEPKTDAEKSFKVRRSKPTEDSRLVTVLSVMVIIISIYLSFACIYFETRHVKAGRGAIIVYFYEVITLGDVPDLK